MKEDVVLQRVLFEGNPFYDETLKMYYRSKRMARKTTEGSYFFPEHTIFDFSTYFNSFALGKWKKYCVVDQVILEIRARGTFGLDLVGYTIVGDQIKKEWFEVQRYDLKEVQNLRIPYPGHAISTVVAFRIETISDVEIFEANYVSHVKPVNVLQPRIALITTTYRKETYIKKNAELLNKELFQEPLYKSCFVWKIIDNGCTLNPSEINNEHIEVIANNNVGGSGGFACGMLMAGEDKLKPTHVLLMDDDVEIIPESFRRLYTLLSFMRPEYKGYFISGAMLEIGQRNIQHEDVGFFDVSGAHGPVKRRFDLNRLKSVVKNEELLQTDKVHQYSGWWFCCIPASVADKDNLPLPLFVRGDDVEYSIRNHAKFITMNGICIWHEGFGGKFSGAMELYQVHRNDLILQAMHDETSDVQVIRRITWLFWEEIYKFNYKGAELILDAVDDYLKGPDFIEALDGAQCMLEKRAKDNHLERIPEETWGNIDFASLYDYKNLKRIKKMLYDYSLNGQRLPGLFCRRQTVYIPYGWGYYPEKQFMAKRIIAIDSVNHLYTIYERSPRRMRQLKKRFGEVMSRYERENERVSLAYKHCEKKWESQAFWNRYLSRRESEF